MFDLELDGLTDETGETVAAACEAVQGWPVVFVPGRVERRWFGIEKSFPPVLEILTVDDGGTILDTHAQRDADTIAMRPEAVGALARTLDAIAAQSPGGFVFRATWSGSPILQDEHLPMTELARRVKTSSLNEFTRYYVDPSS